MKFAVTVENAPRGKDEFFDEKSFKREYRKAQKNMRELRRCKHNRWSEADKDGR